MPIEESFGIEPGLKAELTQLRASGRKLQKLFEPRRLVLTPIDSSQVEQLLAERAARGDRDAMAKIVGSLYPDVFRFCTRRIGVDHAEDAAQETFVIAWKTIKRFEGNSTLRTWFFGIANNVCRNLARKRRVEVCWEILNESGAVRSAEEGILDARALSEAMAKLSDEHREVVMLHEFDSLSYEEISDILAIPIGTVKSRLYHAFSNLRRQLAPSFHVGGQS